MRISLLLPYYGPVAYPGQTPVAYKQGQFIKFERGLAERVTNIFRAPTYRLEFDAQRGVMEYRTFNQYEFDKPDDVAILGAIVSLALDTFALKSVQLIGHQGSLLSFTVDEAADLGAGLHAWSAD
jgi:hypothetical protein